MLTKVIEWVFSYFKPPSRLSMIDMAEKAFLLSEKAMVRVDTAWTELVDLREAEAQCRRDNQKLKSRIDHMENEIEKLKKRVSENQ